MSAPAMVGAAKAAAAMLAGLSASVDLTSNDESIVREFAAFLGVAMDSTVHFGIGWTTPVVIFSANAEVSGVRIHIQGSRPATSADAHLKGFRSAGPGEWDDPATQIGVSYADREEQRRSDAIDAAADARRGQ